jgi:uncharacterized protein (TIRG00374 family)
MSDGNPPPAPLPRTLSPVRLLLGLALLAVVVGFVVTHVEEERGLARLVEESRPGWIALAVVLQVGTYVAGGAAWTVVLAEAGVPLPLFVASRLALEKLFVDRIVPAGGIGGTVLVARVLVARGVPPETATTALLVELLTWYIGFVIAVLVALLALAWRGQLDGVVIFGACVFFVVAVGMAAAIVLLTRARGRTLPAWARRIRPLARAADAFTGASPDLLGRPALLVRTTLLQLLVFALDGGTLATMLLALGRPFQPIAAFSAQALAQAAATIGIVPAGLGTYEATCVAILNLHGVAVAPALAATLLLRGASLWLPLIPGYFLARRDL